MEKAHPLGLGKGLQMGIFDYKKVGIPGHQAGFLGKQSCIVRDREGEGKLLQQRIGVTALWMGYGDSTWPQCGL